MRDVTTRFYSIHLRINGRVADYSAFLERLHAAERKEISVARDYTVVLENITALKDGIFALIFAGGDTDGRELFYDRDTGGVVESDQNSNRWSATLTRVVFSFVNGRRIVAIESRRGGVTPLLLERFLERSSPTAGETEAEITPLTSDSFIDEVDSFERIRIATMEVARPNFDWDDDANVFYELADESSAQSATAEVKAPRGQSLSKNSGLVEIIKSVSRRENPSVRSASVTGFKPGDTREQTVSLGNHEERASFRIDDTLPLAAQTNDLIEKMLSRVLRLIDLNAPEADPRTTADHSDHPEEPSGE